MGSKGPILCIIKTRKGCDHSQLRHSTHACIRSSPSDWTRIPLSAAHCSKGFPLLSSHLLLSATAGRSRRLMLQDVELYNLPSHLRRRAETSLIDHCRKFPTVAQEQSGRRRNPRADGRSRPPVRLWDNRRDRENK